MSDNKFFEQQTASSKIKANIVSRYFPSYCRIISKKNMPKAIRYVDLFAGPGVYDDGNFSTPILIGKQCQKDNFLSKIVKLVFNDKEHAEALKQNFNEQFPPDTFGKKPHFASKTVGQDENIREFLLKDTHVDNKNEYPTLLFIDPFGYKGIETSVLATFMKNWGNEVFLFVNIKRIHPALENDKFDGLMRDLFPTTLETVRKDRRYKLNTAQRIALIIQSLGTEYEAILGGQVFYTAFKFMEEDNEATSHYILHFTKHPRGFDLVKQIYNDFANVGTLFDGVNTYTFDAKKLENETIELFDTSSINIDKLKEAIIDKYAGIEISALKLFDEFQTGHLYSRRHYADALRRLVSENKITATFVDSKKHEVSVLISKDCILKFN